MTKLLLLGLYIFLTLVVLPAHIEFTNITLPKFKEVFQFSLRLGKIEILFQLMTYM